MQIAIQDDKIIVVLNKKILAQYFLNDARQIGRTILKQQYEFSDPKLYRDICTDYYNGIKFITTNTETKGIVTSILDPHNRMYIEDCDFETVRDFALTLIKLSNELDNQQQLEKQLAAKQDALNFIITTHKDTSSLEKKNPKYQENLGIITDVVFGQPHIRVHPKKES